LGRDPEAQTQEPARGKEENGEEEVVVSQQAFH